MAKPNTPVPVQDRARVFGGPELSAGLQAVESALPITPKEHRARKWIVGAGGLFLLWIVLASVIGGAETAPGRALVARDPVAKVYLSPVCAFGRGDLAITSIDAARADGYKPDPSCANRGGFLGASQTVLERNLSHLHLYPKRGTRWNPDGSWKY